MAPGQPPAGAGQPSGRAPHLVVCRDAEELVTRAVQAVAAVLAEAAGGGPCRVALAGGSTPRPVYQRLAGLALPWDRVEWYWGDERCVPPDHPDSNYRMAKEALLDRLPPPPAGVHRMHGEEADAPAAARAYAVELEQSFRLAPGELPRFDLILLGMGAEGHTASLFPDSPALEAATAAPVAAVLVPGHGWRLTLTPPVLRRAARLMFLVAGREKAEALREVLRGPEQVQRYPAQLFRRAEGAVTWLVDREAAALLTGDGGRPEPHGR